VQVGVCLLASLVLVVAAHGAHADDGKRSRAVRAEFHRANPCPATGKTRGACPGHVVDHIEPLCAGGADAARNMQWQTVAEAKAKDREEVKACRRRR
jgi:hypothetical protein